jgi:SAM-dependent methyltransferase
VPSPFDHLVRISSARYRADGEIAWRFARGKLSGDPVYRAVWEGPWIRPGPVVDIGCGQGLMLSLFAGSREQPDLYPQFAWRRDCPLYGIETRPAVAHIAQRALAVEARILGSDARTTPLPTGQTLLLFDVLHMMSAGDQDALLDAALAALSSDGVLLIREADASAGWRFRLVRWANRGKALLKGYSSRSFHFRSSIAWKSWLESRGLAVETHPMHAGTPFGNHLLIARRR